MARAFAVELVGLDGHVVEVEADLAQGLPGMAVIGMPDAALAEARDRLRHVGQHPVDERVGGGVGVGIPSAFAPPLSTCTTRIVVEFHASVPSDSGASAGTVYASARTDLIVPRSAAALVMT